jgi:hypothetical protein
MAGAAAGRKGGAEQSAGPGARGQSANVVAEEALVQSMEVVTGHDPLDRHRPG